MTQIFLYLKYNLQQHKHAKASPSQKKKKKSIQQKKSKRYLLWCTYINKSKAYTRYTYNDHIFYYTLKSLYLH